MNTADFNALMTQLYIHWIAVSIVGTAITFGLLYVTVRLAVKDGMIAAHQLTRRSTRNNAINGPDLRAD